MTSPMQSTLTFLYSLTIVESSMGSPKEGVMPWGIREKGIFLGITAAPSKVKEVWGKDSELPLVRIEAGFKTKAEAEEAGIQTG